jgi:glycosyltransferase involved in cell wall biosynthesis
MSLQYYLLFNPDLKKYDMTTIKKGLYDDIQTNNRITSIESFFKKYTNFDINIYKKFYPETGKMNLIETLIYMNINYDPVNTIYSRESFLKKYPLFKETETESIEAYYAYHIKFKDICEDIPPNNNLENTLSENIINDSILENTINENTIVEHNIIEYDIIEHNIIEYDIIEHDIIEHNIIEQTNTLKLAHVFIHLFKIGGGEAYLKQFHKANSENLFEETLFISRVHHPCDIDTLFDFNDMNLIYYDSYEALNKYLREYNVIIDHQLYWFEPEITQTAFMDLDESRISIIRIIHGAPIHYQDIKPYNFRYSIELYKDTSSHISWNNHIKHYVNIGVDIPNQSLVKKQFPGLFNLSKSCENNKDNLINVLIIGRICEEKVPHSFLKSLYNFVKNISGYQFNFYGIIDKSYETAFIREINKINKLNKTNPAIKYHGIIHPNEINDVYRENHILMHPSQNEAGGTVILEAMSHGLPVICKNRGGIRDAVGDIQFLCETDDEMFEKLLLINENNYNDISSRNKLKILENNQALICFPQLLNEIKLIHDINSTDGIPNIIHYIFGLIPQTDEFSFVYFMSIYSNYVINNPRIIYFHCQYEPYGYWWNKAQKYIKINYIRTDSDSIDTYSMKWGKKPIVKYAHKADKLRLEILNKYGGIYMDMDTITIRPYHHLIKDDSIDFVIGIQEQNYLNRDSTLYCNAILMSKKDSPFIKKWMEMYEKYFMTEGWCEASVHLPQKVLKKMNKSELQRIKILDKSAFYNPSYNEVNKIFEKITHESDNIIDAEYKDLLTLHLWNSFSNKYYKDIDLHGFYWPFKNENSNHTTLYGECIKYVMNQSTNSDKQDKQKMRNSQIYDLSVIMIYGKENNDSGKDIIPDFKNILEQEYIYNLNIEIIIIINAKNELSNLFSDLTIKHELLLRMIDLYIIETNAVYSDDMCNKIGMEYANYDTIFYCDFNETFDKNEFIDFFEDVEDVELKLNSKQKIASKEKFNHYLQYVNAIYKL